MITVYRAPLFDSRPEVPKLFVPGWMYLFQACDIVGKVLFRGDWNGREVLARPIRAIGSEPPRPLLGKAIVETDSGACSECDAWLVSRRDKIMPCKTKGEADEAWEADWGIVEKEREARRRFETVVDWLRMQLASGDIKAQARVSASGLCYEIPARFWGSDKAAEVFELQDQVRRWEKPNWYRFAHPALYPGTVVGVEEGNVIIDNAQLAAITAQLSGSVVIDFEQPRPDTTGADNNARSTPPSGAGGPDLQPSPSTKGAKANKLGRPRNNDLTEVQLRAVEIEVKLAGVQPAFALDSSGKLKWPKPAKSIADKANVPLRTIQAWRTQEDYRAEVESQQMRPRN